MGAQVVCSLDQTLARLVTNGEELAAFWRFGTVILPLTSICFRLASRSSHVRSRVPLDNFQPTTDVQQKGESSSLSPGERGG